MIHHRFTKFLLFHVVALVALLSGCIAPIVPPAGSAAPAPAGPLAVVATYSVLGDLVKQVAGDQIELTVLVGADSDPHVYEPTPQDGVALAEADLLLENGLAFESWLDDLYTATGSQAKRIAVSDGVDMLTFSGHEHDHDAASEAADHEYEAVTPHRLAVADGEAAVVHLLDVASGAVLASYDLAGAARVYTGPDGGLLYAVQQSANQVNVIDSGLRLIPHDDHEDLDWEEPALLDFTLAGTQPVHFVSHDEQIAIFNDGDGTAMIFTETAVRENGPVQTIDSGRPHHGVAVPLDDVVIISLPDPEDAAAALPVGVTVRTLAGEVVATLADCPGLHGEASLSHDVAAFGCSDGVLMVERTADGWQSTKILNPTENPNNARVGTLAYNEAADLLVGNLSRDGIVLIDRAAGTMTTVTLPAPLWAFALSPYDPHVIVALALDGALYTIDGETGAVVGSVAVVDAFEPPQQDEHNALRPALLAAGDMAYVSNPATGEVIEVHLAELAVERRLAVAGAPVTLAAVGAMADPHAADHDETEAEADEHGEFDPHTWMSPLNAIVMVENIAQALAAADPANAATYQANAAAYTAELEQLDAEMRAQFATIPAAQRILVTTHDLFGYFARDYGFTVLGSALNSVTTEAADPSAAQIATLVEEIRTAGVPAIFVENVGNADLMQQIANEAGVTLAPPLHTHGLGAAGSGAEDYLGMMRTNATIITTALVGQ